MFDQLLKLQHGKGLYPSVQHSNTVSDADEVKVSMTRCHDSSLDATMTTATEGEDAKKRNKIYESLIKIATGAEFFLHYVVANANYIMHLP